MSTIKNNKSIPPFKDPKFGPLNKPWSEQIPDIAKSNNYPNGYIIKPPCEDSIEIYTKKNKHYPYQQENIAERHCQLPPNGQAEERLKILKEMQKYYYMQRDNFLGYQCAEQFEISKDIAPFLNMSINNVGDPFENGYQTLNSKQAERSVLDFFASLWHANWPSLAKPSTIKINCRDEYIKTLEYKKYEESYWGYILSMGSTEGNLYAILSARDYLSGFSLIVNELQQETLCSPIQTTEKPNKYIPVAFYSQAAHYSLTKAVHAIQVKTFFQIAKEKITAKEPRWECPLGDKWPESVPVDENESVKIDSLIKLVEFFVKKGYVPFICFNYGTTFTGAYDDIQKACQKLQIIFDTYGLNHKETQYLDTKGNIQTDYRRGYWIHVDGALGASLMPFVEMAVAHNKLDSSLLASCFDFRNEAVMSIVTSGHKWIGSPVPTGIYMTKNKYLITPVASPDYIGSPDTTFSGSRNGMSAMIMWNMIAKQGIQGFVNMAEITMNLCEYTACKLKELQKKLGNFDIWIKQAPNGGTSFIFRKPVDEIMFKYSIPIERKITKVKNGIKQQTYAHLFIFWDRSKETIDSLIKELSSIGAFDPKAEQLNTESVEHKDKYNSNSTNICKYKGFK